jgi:hypothetical protein
MKPLSVLLVATGSALAVIAGCVAPAPDRVPDPPAASGDGDAVVDGAPARGGQAPADAADAASAEAPLVWPNDASFATSDPWLVAHHDELAEMRPKVITINFDNDPASRTRWKKHVEQLIAGFAEGSRYHGYADASARPFLRYEVAQWVDMADPTPPPGWTHAYSSRLPVNCAPDAFYKFDYAALFSEAFAANLGGEPLCDLFEKGKVHEVWLHWNGDPGPHVCANGTVLPDAGAAEILESKPKYTAANVKKPGEFERCAGNGCLGDHDFAAFKACGRTVRVLYINSTRGPGCAIHSAGHGYEWMARSRAVPELTPRFEAFGNFDLDDRLRLPFSDWYACSTPDCLTFTGPNALTWKVGAATGTVAKLDQACGNVHFAPNARGHYDENANEVLSRCEHFGQKDGPDGGDKQELFSRAKYSRYESLAPDCGGAWQVYWRQSFPGRGNTASDPAGKPMRNWWPYLFY